MSRARTMVFCGALVVAGAHVAGCSSSKANDIALTASPAHASMFGQVDVELTGDFARLGAIQSVRIGDIAALDVRATSASSITVRVQGAPSPGHATVTLVGANQTATNDSAFAYDPQLGGAPAKWIAFGASLTEGIQSGGLDAHGQVFGWAPQLARAAGVFFAPPLVVDGLVPALKPADFVGHCDTSMDVGKIGNGLFGTVYDDQSKTIDLRRGRLDATLRTRNIAIGGAKLSDIIDGSAGPQRLLARVTELPDGDPSEYTQPLQMPQLARLVKEDADVGVCADLLANDSDPAVTASDDLHIEVMTDLATITLQLHTIMDTLGKLHGDYFIANLVDLGGVPNVADLRAKRIAAGTDTVASFDAKLDAIRAVIDQYNAALETAASPYANIHIVDLASDTKVALKGVTIGGELLTGAKFGGLTSLDHLHFTDTGYALVANVFVNAMNIRKGWRIPEVNVEAVHKNDALSPSSLHAAGVHCDPSP